MLEVRNLTKVYKTKGGADVRALDGVSLRFPEKGMVFLLGKSGSGKSTLLNVCGGLDDPTAGEIIVKGRSSESFSQSDFDSYRNTFIGFIFQEYNILNEFSVEDNIALALELQGKPKDKEAVAKLLADVDLTGYAKRKPNTLSGGQKQRIAIARALIKSPEIIMADEPTGALDSGTGKQVFDTLKKLSRDKLVIVVSHDREFAELYGDRVIELKDGRILSDVSKTQEEQTVLSEGISAIGETLCVKKGTKLSDKDFATIKAFLEKAEGDVLIAGGEKDVKSFKEVNRINDEGEREVFRDTDEKKLPKKAYKPEDSRFIRSRLPMRHAIRIGGSGLKTKPFRLVFTSLLCTVAFVLFGVLSTMTFYDSSATLRQTLMDSSLSMVRVDKSYKSVERFYANGELEHEYDNYSSARFHPDELAAYRKTYGDGAFGALSVNTQLSAQPSSRYYQPNIAYLAALEDGHPLIDTAIPGSTYPTTPNEIWLSSYIAEALINSTVYDADGNAVNAQTAADLLGKKFSVDGTPYTVTGVFASGEIDAKYDSLKDNATDNMNLQYQYQSYLTDGLYQVAFVTEDALERFINRYGGNDMWSVYGEKYLVFADRYSEENGFIFNPDVNWSNAKYCSYDDLLAYVAPHFFEAGKTSLAAGELLVPAYTFYDRISIVINEVLNSIDEDGNAKRDRYNQLNNYASILREGGEWVPITEEKDSPIEFRPLSDADRKAYHEALMDAFDNDEIFLSATYRLYDSNNGGAFGEAYTKTIVGVYDPQDRDQGLDTVFLMNEADADALYDLQKDLMPNHWENETKYKEKAGSIFSTVFLPYDHSEAATDHFVALYQARESLNEADWTRVAPRCSVTDGFDTVDSMVSELKQIFLWVGLVLAVFAALLLSNFISVSISHKKREIGILRAVGARSTDVFKIFFSESLIITAICVALSLVGSIVLCEILNAEVASMIGASLFVFGILSFAVLIGVALLTAVIATFLPVYNAAKKKPVDSIRAL